MIPTIVKSLNLPRENGKIVIPPDWSFDNIFQYSIYYKNDLNKPLYEVFIIAQEDGSKGMEHHPWIAITPLRHARITSRIKNIHITYDYVDYELVDGFSYRVYDYLIRYTLGSMGESVEVYKKITYSKVKGFLLDDLRNVFEPPIRELACAWLVSCVIGLRLADIDYNI
jgi:hypothetical protein